MFGGQEKQARINLSGTWTGEYQYAPPAVGVPAAFILNLRQGWLGRITGTVQDGPEGMPEEGKVTGWLRGNRLTFRKQMPVFRVASEGRTVPLAEYLAASGELRISANMPHPSILYEGTAGGDGQSLSGVWNVSESVIRLAGQARALQFPGYKGSWVARRRE